MGREEPLAEQEEEGVVNVSEENPLQELHDDIEAALFAAQAGSHRSRDRAMVTTKLEEALLWAKRAIEKGD